MTHLGFCANHGHPTIEPYVIAGGHLDKEEEAMDVEYKYNGKIHVVLCVFCKRTVHVQVLWRYLRLFTLCSCVLSSTRSFYYPKVQKS